MTNLRVQESIESSKIRDGLKTLFDLFAGTRAVDIPERLPAVTIAGNLEVRLSMFIERPLVSEPRVPAVPRPSVEDDLWTRLGSSRSRSSSASFRSG